ncbi:MAG: zinc ribbon domain-containing protein [Clostridia bacterium]|nr:zinc ribbon domain-containing protein [Clostridia bacterium]
MSKFCANCGAQADDAAAVCGNCGAFFGEAPAVDTPSKGIANLKKYIKPAIALVVAAVVVIFGIKLLSGFIGAKGAARKFCNATKKKNADSLAQVLSIKYGEDDEDKEKYAENMLGISDDEDEDEDDTKISFKIKESKKVSSSELKAIKKYIENKCDEDDDYVTAAKKVKIVITTKDKKTGDGQRYTSWYVFTKENGKWKYFDTYYTVKNMAKGKSSGAYSAVEDYSKYDDDDDYSDYYDDDYDW